MFAEYRRSLKLVEAEELFDLVFYRPLAFGFVKAVYRTPITPNQVTVLSMLCGIAAGYNFALGTTPGFAAGAIWYAIANVLDCADGQLARLQNSGTPLGRIVDGVADYVASVAIFVGLGIGLNAAGSAGWVLVIAAGISSAIHAMQFDKRQGEYIAAARGKESFVSSEKEKFEAALRAAIEQKKTVKAFTLRAYLSYNALQSEPRPVHRDPERYRAHNRTMIRLWSVLGPTTNRTMLIVCALFERPEVFLIAVCSVLNCWLVLCLIAQQTVDRRLAESDGNRQ